MKPTPTSVLKKWIETSSKTLLGVFVLIFSFFYFIESAIGQNLDIATLSSNAIFQSRMYNQTFGNNNIMATAGTNSRGQSFAFATKRCHSTQSIATSALEEDGDHPPIGAGLSPITDYDHSRWFVDVMKHCRPFGVANHPWDKYTGTYNSTTFYPNQSFGLVVLSNVDPIHEAFMYGTYKLSFKGQATVNSDNGIADNGVTVTNQQYDGSTNTTTADVYFDLAKGTQIHLNFIDPFNIDQLKMISPGYSTTDPPLIRNEMVKILNQFNQLRFMDWLLTNGNVSKSWADRHLPSLPGTVNRNNDSVGCSWEDICTFANQLNKDIWVNIPANVDDDYVTQCATLLKNNLNPNINVYVEYSNEVWNYFSYGFQQSVDNLNAANAEVSAGNSTLNNDGETNEYAWASRRVVKRIYEISNLFKTVWGAVKSTTGYVV